MAYADKKQYEQAEKMYQKAISLAPSAAVAYHNLVIFTERWENRRRARKLRKGDFS
jgi:tetratricopeptide (TPR) repeat protein